MNFSRRPCFIVIHIVILVLIGCHEPASSEAEEFPSPSIVPIGVVLDTNSSLGAMLDTCIQIAVSDFYANASIYATMLKLYSRNADNLLDANLAVLDLLEHEEVEAIIGPQGSTQDIFVSELGQRSRVPNLSFTARSLDLSGSISQNKYYVRTTVDDSIQARAVAAICQGFQWPQVVLMYEDTEYGHQFQSHLSNAFRDVEIGLVHLTPIPLSASENYISKHLSTLKEQETRVFLVHMSPSLGFRLFNVAKNVGMMIEGYAWIISDSITNFLSSTDAATRDSMEGVIGVRPYVPSSKKLINFLERYERNSSRVSMAVNVYGLWAYDTITALAIAAENIAPFTPRSCKNNIVGDASLRISSYGPHLLQELSRARFRGLSGYFQLIDGSLKPREFEIINLIGTAERRLGLWNSHRGIIRESRSSGEANYSTSITELKHAVWPGDSITAPKGWSIPSSGILRVGVPWKPGFKEFVDAEIDPATNETSATGFSIDIFLYALKLLPFPVNYTFHCYNESTNSNWSYDSMLHEIPQNYDMVVADATIWGARASYVDFTLPYAESEVVLVVRNNRPFNMWTFLKPLRWDLWMTIVGACVLMGFVIWRLELSVAREGIQDERLHIPFLVPVAVLAFQERALVGRKTSLFVLVCWLFTAFVLMQSYTANLSAILTLDRLRFSFSEDHYFGYHKGSFTYDFLIQKLHMDPTRLIPYSSVEEYHDAMSKGSKNGGIDGIFDELPYMKILLNRYDYQYKIIGPKYITDGFGFALPIGSPLVAYFSRAILNVTQGPDMISLEEKNFGPGYSSQDPLSNTVSQGASSLTFHDFAGLFILAAAFTFVALAYVEGPNLIRWGKEFVNGTKTNGNYGSVPTDVNDAPNAAAGGHGGGGIADNNGANVNDAPATGGGGGTGGVVGDGIVEDRGVDVNDAPATSGGGGIRGGGGDGTAEDRGDDVNGVAAATDGGGGDVRRGELT